MHDATETRTTMLGLESLLMPGSLFPFEEMHQQTIINYTLCDKKSGTSLYIQTKVAVAFGFGPSSKLRRVFLTQKLSFSELDKSYQPLVLV